MTNYVLAQESNRANIPDRLWYAMEETDLEDIAANENIATGDKVYVIKQGKTYIFGEDSEWYVSGKSSGGGGTSVDVEPLAVNANGTYTAAEGTAYSPVTVDVPQTTVESLAVAANGTYTAQAGTAYSPVTVNVPQTTVESLSVSANGTYTAQAGKAYSPVTVNVAAVSKLPSVVDGTVTELTASDLTGATIIRESAFSGATSLTSVVIPTSVGEIKSGAFSNCTGLTSVTIPSSVQSIGQNAFNTCNHLSSVTIPCNTGYQAFAGCSALTSAIIADGVTTIGNSTFNGCTSLASVTIPSSLTSLGGSAFYRCSSITSLVIPSGVVKIDYNTFSGCTHLTSLTMEATTPPPLSGANAFSNTSANLVIYVPAASVDAYKGATNWSAFADKIQAIPS